MLGTYKTLICAHKRPGLRAALSFLFKLTPFPKVSLQFPGYCLIQLTVFSLFNMMGVRRDMHTQLTPPYLTSCYPGYFGKGGLCAHPPCLAISCIPLLKACWGGETASCTKYCNICRANGAHLNFSELHRVSLTLLGPISPSRKKDCNAPVAFNGWKIMFPWVRR